MDPDGSSSSPRNYTCAGVTPAGPLGRAGLRSNRVEGKDGLEKALERKLANLPELDQLFEDARHARGHEDLVALGLGAEPGGEVGNGADRTVVPAALKTNGAMVA